MPKSLLVRKLSARLQQVESDLAEAHAELSDRQTVHLRLLVRSVRLRQANQSAEMHAVKKEEPSSEKAVQPDRRVLAVTTTSDASHADHSTDHAVPPPRANTSPQSARRSRVLNRLRAADASTWARGPSGSTHTNDTNGTNGIIHTEHAEVPLTTSPTQSPTSSQAERRSRVLSRLHAADKNGANAVSTELPFIVEPIAGKGLGCVATRPLHTGERVLAEAPLCVIDPLGGSVEQSVASLVCQQRLKPRSPASSQARRDLFALPASLSCALSDQRQRHSRPSHVKVGGATRPPLQPRPGRDAVWCREDRSRHCSHERHSLSTGQPP